MDVQDGNLDGLILNEEENRTLLQGFYLSRLQGFLFLSEEPALVIWEQALVKRAIYSAYLDCVSVGLTEQARAILQSQESRLTRALVVRN